MLRFSGPNGEHCLLSDKRENYPTKFMKSTKIIFFAALLCVVDSFAVSITPTSPLYSTGGFKDPSDDPLHPTDRSHPWGGGQDLSGARTLAESFSLQFDSVLSRVELWSYDTVDGSTGTLQEIQYAIYTGATQPTGSPVASGLGQIVNSAPLDGHRSHGDSALQVIATVFDLLAPVELLPNVTYWLALTARTDRFGVSNNSQWAEAGNGAAGGTYLDQAGTGWIPVAGDRAFQLDGAGSGVPDAGSSLLLLVLAMVPLAKLGRSEGRPEI